MRKLFGILGLVAIVGTCGCSETTADRQGDQVEASGESKADAIEATGEKKADALEDGEGSNL